MHIGSSFGRNGPDLDCLKVHLQMRKVPKGKNIRKRPLRDCREVRLGGKDERGQQLGSYEGGEILAGKDHQQ